MKEIYEGNCTGLTITTKKGHEINTGPIHNDGDIDICIKRVNENEVMAYLDRGEAKVLAEYLLDQLGIGYDPRVKAFNKGVKIKWV